MSNVNVSELRKKYTADEVDRIIRATQSPFERKWEDIARWSNEHPFRMRFRASIFAVLIGAGCDLLFFHTCSSTAELIKVSALFLAGLTVIALWRAFVIKMHE